MTATKCPEGWHTGECCCNCKNQITLTKHPWNRLPLFKGSISEPVGIYACLCMPNTGDITFGVIFEFKHGFCEMHNPK